MLLFIILVIVIIVFAAYYMYYVKNMEKFTPKRKHKRELFTEQFKTEYVDFLKKTFKDLLNREPTTYELSLYAEYQNDKSVIITKIKSTGEYHDRSNANNRINVVEHFTDSSAVAVSDQTLESYRQIINVYNTVLDRMPTKYELEFYAAKMKDGFSTDQLRTVLESSREYYILQKNQVNIVNGELPGNITDAQVIMDVRDVYASIYGSGKMPSDYLEDFLKKKYIEYNLDKKKLKQFILLIQNLDDDKDVCANASSSTTNVNVNTSGNTKSNTTTTGNSSATATNTNTNTSTNSNGATKTSSVNSTHSIVKAEDSSASCSTASICNNYINDLNMQYSAYPYDEQYAILNKLNNGNDGLPKQCSNRFASVYHRDLYAEEIQKRNKNELQYSCDRNKYFANEIDNGVLSSSKLTGTLLYEAADTKIGSILPKFEYKNLS